MSRPHSSLWSVPFIAALALGGGSCSVAESPKVAGESSGSTDDPSGGEQPGGPGESGDDVDGGAGDSDEGDGTPGPDGGDGADPGDDGQDGDDGDGLACPVCDDAFDLCSSTATTAQASLACEWDWVRCALPSCDLGDARQCFIVLDACFQVCQTLVECLACSYAGADCY